MILIQVELTAESGWQLAKEKDRIHWSRKRGCWWCWRVRRSPHHDAHGIGVAGATAPPPLPKTLQQDLQWRPTSRSSHVMAPKGASPSPQTPWPRNLASFLVNLAWTFWLPNAYKHICSFFQLQFSLSRVSLSFYKLCSLCLLLYAYCWLGGLLFNFQIFLWL